VDPDPGGPKTRGSGGSGTLVSTPRQDNTDSNVLPRRKNNYLGDTLEEIVNVTADSPHRSKLLLGAEPLLHLTKIRVEYKNC
jgi:hypothetical protein